MRFVADSDSGSSSGSDSDADNAQSCSRAAALNCSKEQDKQNAFFHDAFHEKGYFCVG